MYGNIINLVATLRAYYIFFFAKKKTKSNREESVKLAEKERIEAATERESDECVKKIPSKTVIKWDKTDHEFLNEKQLSRYRRNLGDALLMRKAITPKELKNALEEANKLNMRFGRYLIKKGIVSEDIILDALGDIQQTLVVSKKLADQLDFSRTINDFNIDDLKRLNVIPIIRRGEYYVVAISVDDSDEVLDEIRHKYGVHVIPAYISQAKLTENLNNVKKRHMSKNLAKVYSLCEKGVIDFEQFINIENYAALHNEEEDKVMQKMGLPA